MAVNTPFVLTCTLEDAGYPQPNMYYWRMDDGKILADSPTPTLQVNRTQVEVMHIKCYATSELKRSEESDIITVRVEGETASLKYYFAHTIY